MMPGTTTASTRERYHQPCLFHFHASPLPLPTRRMTSTPLPDHARATHCRNQISSTFPVKSSRRHRFTADDGVTAAAATGDWLPRSRDRWRHNRCAGGPPGCNVDTRADADHRCVAVCSRRRHLSAHLLQEHQADVGARQELQGRRKC